MARKTTSITGRRPSSAPAGFTLIELIVVMLVVAVAMGIIAPSLSGFARARADAEAAENVLAQTNLARNLAATMGTVSRVNFDYQNNTCWVTVQQAGAFVELNTSDGMPVALPEEMSVRLELPADQEPRTFVQFLPDGRAEQAIIWLGGRDGRIYKVACPSATDRFRIIKPGQEL